ncbi:MAG: LD-carboxypeptidase, partial [Gemmatimonadetes bacterium]|nr:LD-carboxypeptidase [Gemmatimonadota bacterium]NIQ55910.1 LD-carboxypeptidase [Gemmatimonadota bacterium]NIU79046.1 LD-carboxypeptidase [Gammaproteobacteria bacterium]NIX45660.1 LD-carboxypeptidase [Gemmatimonadota bacterium]NIY09961.1 LD-carboxypeptidase [Gemmatimonadota bacterium]
MALIAPAGPVDDDMIERAVARCRRLGFEPVPGASIRERSWYLAGPDRVRAADLQWAIDGDVAGIWAIRGGYGTLRTLDHVDLRPLRERPRPFIGFSDNTAVHLALLDLGVVSFHGPHAGFEHFPAATEEAFRRVLMRPEPAGELTVPGHARPTTIRGGRAEGPLVGGNLALLAAVAGTPYQPETRGALLFIEELAEPFYRVDRMLTQLRLAGLLEGVAGVLLGEFADMPVEDDVGGPELDEVLADLLAPLGVPVVFGLPFGHDR